jgi:hypothetical protein
MRSNGYHGVLARASCFGRCRALPCGVTRLTRQHGPPETAPTRNVVAAALVLLVLGGLGALQAGRAGAAFTRDLELERSALARTAPALYDPHTPPLARRVFVVIIDGLRLDKSYELPFLDELRRDGVDSEARTHYPSWSRPNYVAILTGVPPRASGVRTNHHPAPVTLDTLMDRARAAGLRTASATDYDVLPRLFLRPREPETVALADPRTLIRFEEIDDSELDIEALGGPETAAAVRAPDANLVSPFDDARYAPWPGGFSEAGAAIAAGQAELVVMLVGAVDAAGHGRGGASPEYRLAAQVADRALSRALAGIDLSMDAVIITSDHGHTDRGGHGGIEPEVMTVPLILAGAGVRPGTSALDAQLVDLAPTVAALLGIPAPGHGLGRTLVELLDLDAPTATRRQIADQLRTLHTRGVVASAEARAARDVLENRARRIAVVLGGALIAVALAFLLIRRRVLRLDVRVLLVSVPTFFIVYYGLIGTLGRFSPSLLPARGHLAFTLAQYGLAALAVHLLFSLWLLRSYKTVAARLAAANGIAWTGLMLAMIPAGLAWAFFPPPYVTVPGPLWLVLIPAVQVAVAGAAIGFAITLVVELIVFVARAYYRAPLRASGAASLGPRASGS